MTVPTSVPDAKSAPKPRPRPSYKPEILNFAGNKESVEKALKWIQPLVSKYEGQGSRSKFDKNCDAADEMWRMAQTQTQTDSDQSDNKDAARSNLPSSTFNRTHRIITAGEKAVILGNEEGLPLAYDPISGVDDYTAEEGERIARDQEFLMAYTLDAAGNTGNTDSMREEIGRTLFYLNKYGTQLIGIDWREERADILERVPTFHPADPDDPDAPRRRKGSKWENKSRIICDWPALVRPDMKDVLFDTQIKNEQLWPLLSMRGQTQLANLWGMQSNGDIMNVGDITKSHFYQGESTGTLSDQLDARQSNAGEDGDTQAPNGLVDCYTIWVRLPIDVKTGTWNEKKKLPTWFKTLWAGDIRGTPLCLMMSPNPTFTPYLPYKLLHSHEDDKGAIGIGLSTLLESFVAMEKYLLQNAFDNIRERTWAPWICEYGSVSKRDKTYDPDTGRELWWKQQGAEDPHEITVTDTTGTVVSFHELIQKLSDDTGGVNKTLQGEPLGSRTSSNEASNVYEQGMKPALVDAGFKAGQILPFVGFWVQRFWRLFGDPRRTMIITHGGETREIKPTELWGPLRVRVTSIKNFMDSIISRQEENQFLSTVYPLMQERMAPEAKDEMFRQVAKNRQVFTGVDKWFGGGGDADAKKNAQAETEAILMNGVRDDVPQQGENHTVHLSVHEPHVAEYGLFPDADPEAVQAMDLHIQQHKNMAGQQGAAQGAPQAAAPESAPRNAGEAAGDMMGAAGGALQNAPVQGLEELQV